MLIARNGTVAEPTSAGFLAANGLGGASTVRAAVQRKIAAVGLKNEAVGLRIEAVHFRIEAVERTSAPSLLTNNR